GHFPHYRRTSPAFVSKCRRAIHRFDSANSVTNCAVFFARPRKRVFTYPNWRLITRNGSSTLARTWALDFSILRLALYSALRLLSFLYVLRRAAICQITSRPSCSGRFSTPV